MAIAPSQLAVAMGSALIQLAVIIACANFIHRSGRQLATKRVAGQPPEIRDAGFRGSNSKAMNVKVDMRNAPTLPGVNV